VSIARVSQIEHGEVISFEVIARYVEALGGRLNLGADFGDRTVRLPVSDTATGACEHKQISRVSCVSRPAAELAPFARFVMINPPAVPLPGVLLSMITKTCVPKTVSKSSRS
jgi:hypothetical protein